MNNDEEKDIWLKPHVNGHLIFGLYKSKHKKIWLPVIIVLYLLTNWSIDKPSHLSIEAFLQYSLSIENIIFILMILYFAFFTNFTQSMFFWVTTKITLALMGFILTLSGVIALFQASNEWKVFFSIGILWFPSIEFHPLFLKYQKLISVIRFVVTIIILNT